LETIPQIRPYPWHALKIVAREAADLLRDARRAVRGAIDECKIAEALSELLGEHVGFIVSDVMVAAEDGLPLHGSTLTLATSDDAVRIQLDVERDLARTLVARVIGRSARFGDPQLPLAPEIEGGLLAIVCAVARRAHGSAEALRSLGPGALRLAPGERRLDVHATLLIGSDAYGVRATIQLRKAFAMTTSDAAAELTSLGELSISLPVVAAVSIATPAEMHGISPGDVWMPGDGWTVRRADAKPGPATLAGEIICAAPAGDRGIRAKLGEGGEIVVVGVQAAPYEAEATAMSGNQNDFSSTSDVVLDAPLVVRVEIGAVTLTAREWAALRPGDVVALARRVSEPVVLRIAGIEVARGELVDIEGELGVRIREQVKAT
jgi:flagellar motor switch/type III secretory pathway protein FliN